MATSLEIRKNARSMHCHDTGLCDSCGVPETVQHFLLECSSDLVTGVKRLCDTLKLPHTLDAVLGNAGVHAHTYTERPIVVCNVD
jgi:hypothetical protein